MRRRGDPVGISANVQPAADAPEPLDGPGTGQFVDQLPRQPATIPVLERLAAVLDTDLDVTPHAA